MTNQNAKISVIIPSYNKSKFIAQTLNSIVNQNYPNLEVIIQDGGSTDGTVEIIKRFVRKNTNVRWESKKDKGQLDAINKGFAKSTGEILTYINADDSYVKNAFKNIAKSFYEHPEAVWFAGRGVVIDSKGHEIAKLITWYKNMLLNLNSRFLLLTTNYLMQPSVFITRDAYKKFGPFSGTAEFITEYDTWLKLSRIGMPFVVNETLSKFRISSSSITQRMTKRLLKEDEKIVTKYTDNFVVLFLHRLNNLGRILIGRIV